jgi:hypothetical protein
MGQRATEENRSKRRYERSLTLSSAARMGAFARFSWAKTPNVTGLCQALIAEVIEWSSFESYSVVRVGMKKVLFGTERSEVRILSPRPEMLGI